MVYKFMWIFKRVEVEYNEKRWSLFVYKSKIELFALYINQLKYYHQYHFLNYLKECILCTTCVVMSLAGSNIQQENIVLPFTIELIVCEISPLCEVWNKIY